MFHQPRKVFPPKEVVNPLGELRHPSIVFSAEVHTAIMEEILSIKTTFAGERRASYRNVERVRPSCLEAGMGKDSR